MKSFEEKQFVQPVTIALLNSQNESKGKNLILDGQQRLISVLLAYMGYAPDTSKFEEAENTASEDDSENNDPDGTKRQKAIKWTFRELLSSNADNNTRDSIVKRLQQDSRYKRLEPISTPLDFFDKVFLGFSYIVPQTKDPAEIEKRYAKMFRNMNYFGKRLSAIESRQSLYYMKSEYRCFFEGKTRDNQDVLCNIKISDNLQANKIDLVRYLSTLAQYSITGNAKNVLKWYSSYSSRESYYADFVSYLLGLEQEENPLKFSGFSFNSAFPNECWLQRYETLKQSVEDMKKEFVLNKNEAFSSWIDADYWLFGLIYYIVFEGKVLVDNRADLFRKIKNRIKVAKGTSASGYSKNPNQLGNLRARLIDSLSIYKKYVQ